MGCTIDKDKEFVALPGLPQPSLLGLAPACGRPDLNGVPIVGIGTAEWHAFWNSR
jgi:hypothetical protein